MRQLGFLVLYRRTSDLSDIKDIVNCSGLYVISVMGIILLEILKSLFPTEMLSLEHMDVRAHEYVGLIEITFALSSTVTDILPVLYTHSQFFYTPLLFRLKFGCVPFGVDP